MSERQERSTWPGAPERRADPAGSTGEVDGEIFPAGLRLMSSPASAHAARQAEARINTGKIYCPSSSTSSFTFQCQETFSSTAKILDCDVCTKLAGADFAFRFWDLFFPPRAAVTPSVFLIFRSVSKRASAFFAESDRWPGWDLKADEEEVLQRYSGCSCTFRAARRPRLKYQVMQEMIFIAVFLLVLSLLLFAD